MLVVEIDEKEHVDRDPDYEKKRQKELINLVSMIMKNLVE